MKCKTRLLIAFIFFLAFKTYAFTTGVNIRLLGENKITIAKYLDTVKSIGINSIRVDMPWSLVEKNKGVLSVPENWDYFVNYANSKGLSVLCILDYGNKYYDEGDKPRSPMAVIGFTRYVDFLTGHFGDRIKFYQIWNEWNGRTGKTTPGTVDSYKNIVKSVYPTIKKNAPQSTVITGSFSSAAFNKAIGVNSYEDYLRDYLTSDMANFTDAISVHPYTTYRKYPFNGYSYYLKQIIYAYNLVKSNNLFKNKRVFITEIGWSTSQTPFGVSMDYQANLLSKAICDAKKIGYSGVYVYNFKDSKSYSSNTEDGFGLFHENLVAKKAATTISEHHCY